MAILATIKSGAGKIAGKVANKGGNIVAKASGLSSAQLEKIEEKRNAYLMEKPETDPESIERLLGSYAIEAYEAYLPQLSELYKPMFIGEADDERSLDNRIRYFEVTKWVTDPTEDNLDKLTNMYHVLSEENCNIALIFNRRVSGTTVFFAVVNNSEKDTPHIADMFGKRLESSLLGNFPGAEIKKLPHDKLNAGVIPVLKDIKKSSVAIVSNIASEKSEKFISQSMEKLIDGIVPSSELEEYTIVLLATPVKEQLERKNALSELYSKLAPFSTWSTTFTLSETTAVGSSATFGANLGGSAGRQIGDTTTAGTNSSRGTTASDSTAHTDSSTDSTTDGTNSSTSSGTSDTTNQSTSQGTSTNTSTANMTGENTSVTDTDSATGNVTITPFGIGASGSTSNSTANQTGTSSSTTNTTGSGTSTTNTSGSGHTITQTATQGLSHAETAAKGLADTVTKGKSITDTIGRMASTAHSVATNIGMNFGVNFSRSSNVTVLMGKNDALTQNFINYDVKNTLELIEKQIKRVEQSTALGMWDFSAYFMSESPIIANNTAHMYLALTQGENSYLSQSAVNLWEYREERKDDIANIMDFIRRLQHPEFELDITPDDPSFDQDWLMYPPHVNATVSLTGRELAYSLNLPKKSVSGLPVLESVAFGREVQKFTPPSEKTPKTLIAGNVYHMRKEDKNIRVKLDMDSLCAHTFITGSTGTGKSNFIYNLLEQIYEEDKHFLVIEPAKGEYKNVLGGFDDVSVYGTNPMYTELLHINPFSFPKHINVLEHIDRLVEIFNACWPMYAAMPAVLKDAIERVYKDKGWIFSNPSYYSDDFPTFADLIKVLPDIMNESLYSADTKSDYSGALITRVKSLTNGINGEIFCSTKEISNEALFDRNVIVDISRVGSVETKSLIMGILIMKLQEYRMQPDKMNESLQHITVLEEAHNLLRRTSFAQAQESSNLQGKSVEMLTNAIAEMRTYGEGFIIADQAPDMLDEAVIRNTNTKIIFRLPDEHDCELVGKSIALSDVQIKELAKLPAFVAVIHQNDWIEAVLCKSEKYDKERKYSFSKKENNLSAYRLMLNIYGVSEKITLSDEEKTEVLDWINRLENGDNTKCILRKGLSDESLTEEEKLIVAYNVFGGHRTAMLLRNAENNEVGLIRVRRSIGSVFSLDSDDKLIDTVQQYICIAINREETCADIARRYQYFGMNGGIM
ncbi:AAA-like domain-containing protein [Ruminococcus sp. YRD2003]|uniref:helicase HerA domain-containing protein n=1 Tax=Ruminococcus sp. YRD2003 TaxID=1452313 RepID=UPI0008C65005|nr:AAA-like domain-containing protein [Ruminococcus flavefaciens]